MRAIPELHEQWLLNLRADYGGFGIGSGSDSTYQLAAVTEYATEGSLRFGLGWRYLMFDRSHGSGIHEDAQHIRLSGPLFGMMFRF